MMKVSYTIDRNQSDQFISFLILGVLYSLEHKLISIDDAEGFIFMPSVAQILCKAQLPNELIDIIESGCELDDIVDLVPEQLNNNIKELMIQTMSVLKNSKKVGRLLDKKIDIIMD